jgi:hypothetical protein
MHSKRKLVLFKPRNQTQSFVVLCYVYINYSEAKNCNDNDDDDMSKDSNDSKGFNVQKRKRKRKRKNAAFFVFVFRSRPSLLSHATCRQKPSSASLGLSWWPSARARTGPLAEHCFRRVWGDESTGM